jgi:glycosyltransferase involved in cell wall biosynthesis
MNAPVSERDEARAVLMVANGYPPDGQYPLRTVLFAKYLPLFGWRGAILAPRGRGAAPADEAFTYRAYRPPTPSTFSRRLHRTDFLPRTAEPHARRRGFGVPRVLRSLALWLETPDALAGWIPFAVLRGLALVRQLDVKVIHASGPPFSVILAGMLIARLSGRPLVADFRDAWALDTSDPFGTLHGGFQAPRSERRVGLLRHLERLVLGGASAVLFTSAYTMQAYRSQYPGLGARAHLILNGFDPADFTDDGPALVPPTVAHVGTVHDYQWHQVQLLLNAFAKAVAKGGLPNETNLVFIGPIGGMLGRLFDKTINDLGLRGRAFRIGAVPHDQAVRWMRGSRVLLLVSGESRHIRLSKISEYLAARRPLLALAARDSETALAVTEHGGLVLDDPTIDAVAVGLAKQYCAASSPLAGGPDLMAHPHPLNRITEASQLAGVLDGVAGTAPFHGGRS